MLSTVLNVNHAPEILQASCNLEDEIDPQTIKGLDFRRWWAKEQVEQAHS